VSSPVETASSTRTHLQLHEDIVIYSQVVAFMGTLYVQRTKCYRNKIIESHDKCETKSLGNEWPVSMQ